MDARYAGPKRQIQALKYDGAEVAYQEKVIEKTDGFSRKEIRFDSGEGGTQQLSYFDVGARKEKRPVIVISPAMGGGKCASDMWRKRLSGR